MIFISAEQGITLILHDLENMRPSFIKKKWHHGSQLTNTIIRRLERCIKQYIKPFDTANHPAELVHVVLGKINSDQNVDVDEAVSLGTLQWKFFCKTMPADFHGGLFAEVKVKMMLSDKKGMQIEDIRYMTVKKYMLELSDCSLLDK